jgi:O-antigen/teichoic acid export membrane protein
LTSSGNKIKKRTSLIAANSLNNLIQPAVNVLFSLIVIKISGTETWGKFVFYMLWATLTSFVMSWGNKDYLLRQFSKAPGLISSEWRTFFFTRLVLLFPSAIVLFVSFSVPESLLLTQWILLLFIVQSFDVLITFHRKFIHSFIIELISGIFLLTAVFLKTGIDIYTVYFIYLLLKVFAFIFIFRKDVYSEFNLNIKLSLLKFSFMFFLIGLTGLLGSRIDQYCVSYFLPAAELGKYQVLKNFLVYTHAGIGFILLPFVKNIYRLQDENINKIANKLFLSGILLFIPYVIILFVIIKYIYGLEFTYISYLYAALMVLPSSYYAAVIYKLFKKNKQSVVVWFNGAITVISLILNILLIPVLKIEGSLIAGMISQLILLILFYVYNNRLKSGAAM